MTKPAKQQKPEKPYPGFPLTANSNGQWCRKIAGKVHNFGPWKDWKAALARHNDEYQYLVANQKPPRGELTVAALGNFFLDAKELDVRSGAITQRTYDEYRDAYQLAIQKFGANKPVSMLDPNLFRQLRTDLAEKWGETTTWNAVRRIRMVFKWGYDEKHLATPMRFGKGFSRTSKRETKRVEVETAEKMFEAAELHMLIQTAKPTLRAWILLGINCAFGQSDISELTVDRINLETGWVNFPRPKTGTARKCPLWPETVYAIKGIKRYTSPTESLANRLFVTKYGAELVRYQNGAWVDGVGQVFNKHLVAQGVKRAGIGFYSLRRTLRTVGDEVKDQRAINLIMGHDDGSMGTLYTQRVSDERLRVVTDHVRNWLNIIPTKVEQSDPAEVSVPAPDVRQDET